jgi:hypothetical protein
MKVNFEKTLIPCVCDEVIAWHVVHGWVWNVCAGRPIGVFYCTVLCGSGAICHFSTVEGVAIPASVILAAFRKGVRMVAPACPVLYATIPETRAKLIRVALRLGFGVVEDGGFALDGRNMVLLKYYAAPKR